MRLLPRLATLAAALFAAPFLAAQQAPVKLQDIVGAGQQGAVPLLVTASSVDQQRVLNAAFGSHGQFRLVSGASSALYTLNFSTAGSTASVTVRGPGMDPAPLTASGSSPRNALLRAADAAVQRITRKPGYFAARLVFTSEKGKAKEVYTSDLFMGELLQITADKSQAVMPKWAPDGNRILYTSFFKGAPDIYLLDLASKRRSTFVSFDGTNTAARFSPDGSRVAMSLSGEGNPELYVSDARGRGIRRITRSPGVDTSPDWSPDGSRLIFTSGAQGRPQLFILPVAGGTPQKVPAISSYAAEPSWAPDGNKIAYTAGVGGSFQIAVYDMVARQGRQVSKAAGDGVEPSWLADSRHLVFTQRSANVRRLAILDTETGKVTTLTDDRLGRASEADVLAAR